MCQRGEPNYNITTNTWKGEKLIRRHATRLKKVYVQRNVIWHYAVFQGMFRRENVDIFLPCTGPKGYVGMRVRRHGPRQMRWHFPCKTRMRQQCRVGVPDHVRPERLG